MTSEVNIYTATSIKGARRTNGAIGYILEVKTEKGPATKTKITPIQNCTQNQAELKVIIEALKCLRASCTLMIYTESDHIVAAYKNNWIEKWEQNMWMTTKKKEVANKAEWEEMQQLLRPHGFIFLLKENHEYRDYLKREVMKEAKER